jgi:tape measure domain-containing protein
MTEVAALQVRLEATTKALEESLNRAGRLISKFENQTNSHLSRIDNRLANFGVGLLRKLGPAAAAIGVAFGGREMLQSVQTIEQLDIRLRNLTASSEDYQATTAYLRDTASRLNIDLITLSDSYARLLALQQGGIINREQVNALTEGFANAAAALGAQSSQINQALYGLSQALSSGTVRAEELNQVVEPLPGLLQRLDVAAGVTAGGFRKLVNDGQVTSDMFGGYLITALNSYGNAAQQLDGTVTGSIRNLNNAWTSLVANLADSGFVSGLASIISMAADMVRGFALATGSTGEFGDALNTVQKVSFTVGSTVKAMFIGVQMAIGAFVEASLLSLHGLASGANVVLRSLPFIGKKIPQGSGLENWLDTVRAKNQALADELGDTVHFSNKTTRPVLPAAPKNLGNASKADAGTGHDVSVAKSLNADQQALKQTTSDLALQNRDLVQSQRDVSAAMQDTGRFADDLGQAASSAFRELIDGADGAKGAMRTLLTSIADSIFEKGVTTPISNMITGALGDLFPFANGGIMTSKGSVPLKTYSSGGIARSPQMALYGEGKRPEAYVPLPDGRSIPVTMNAPSGSAGLSMQQNISIDARGADSSILGKLDQWKEDIKRETLTAVAQQARQGGSFAKAIGKR